MSVNTTHLVAADFVLFYRFVDVLFEQSNRLLCWLWYCCKYCLIMYYRIWSGGLTVFWSGLYAYQRIAYWYLAQLRYITLFEFITCVLTQYFLFVLYLEHGWVCSARQLVLLLGRWTWWRNVFKNLCAWGVCAMIGQKRIWDAVLVDSDGERQVANRMIEAKPAQ